LSNKYTKAKIASYFLQLNEPPQKGKMEKEKKNLGFRRNLGFRTLFFMEAHGNGSLSSSHGAQC